jgi:hypothetical protein
MSSGEVVEVESYDLSRGCEGERRGEEAVAMVVVESGVGKAAVIRGVQVGVELSVYWSSPLYVQRRVDVVVQAGKLGASWL